MSTVTAVGMEMANLRFDAFAEDVASAERRRTFDMALAPARALAGAVRVAGTAIGVLEATTDLPDVFDPRGPDGERLATPVRTQPPDSLECTAYAVAAMMELAWCRRLGTAADVPHLRIDSVFSGKTNLYETARRAAKGVVDEGFTGAAPRKPTGANAWRLEWRRFDGPVESRPATMCRALVEQGPLAISIDVYSDFHQYIERGDGDVYTPAQDAIRRLDAHALCIVGYDLPRRSWIVRNSNAAWGQDGYGRLAWGDVKIRPEYVAIGATSVIHPVP